MILGRLFEALFAQGVTLVATSNRPPDDLYKDGLNRQLFTPFIEMLKEKLDVVAVRGPGGLPAGPPARRPHLAGAQRQGQPAAFDRLWADMLDGAEETGAKLEVLGRKMHLPRAAGGLLRASFASLCQQALGPQDYLAIAERFHTLFLEDVPLLTPERATRPSASTP
jgi:cell division protein ZapE